MCEYSVCRFRKGSAVIYVMLISMLILTMALVMYKLEFNRFKYLQLKKQSLESVNPYDYKREKAISLLYNVLQSESVGINKQDILDFAKTHESACIIVVEDMTMKFCSDKELFLIVFPGNSLYDWNEYYDVGIAGGKIKMSMVSRDLKARDSHAEKKCNKST